MSITHLTKGRIQGFTPYRFSHTPHVLQKSTETLVDTLSNKPPLMKSGKGFTLVELVVSVGLFALVMLVATGAYYTLIALDRRARATNQVVGSLSFAIDTMVRGVRTGSNYRCLNGSVDVYGNTTNGFDSFCGTFSYTDSTLNKTVTYILKSDGTIGRCVGVSSCLDSNASSLTDKSITINYMGFIVRGVGTNPGSPVSTQQPIMNVTIAGTMSGGSGGQTVPFSIQESATQRLIDY